MSTKRKLALPVIGLALVAIIGVVGGLAFSGGSSSSEDVPQLSPAASVAGPPTRPPSIEAPTPLRASELPHGPAGNTTEARSTEATVEPDPDFQSALRSAGISRRGWQTDFSRHSVPYSEIYRAVSPVTELHL